MYKKIHPYIYRGAILHDFEDLGSVSDVPDKDKWVSVDPETLRLDTIRRSVPVRTDGTIRLVNLQIGETGQDYVTILASEAEEIDKVILKDGNQLDGAVEKLSAVVNKLIQALDRLAVKIPTPIRLHM